MLAFGAFSFFAGPLFSDPGRLGFVICSLGLIAAAGSSLAAAGLLRLKALQVACQITDSELLVLAVRPVHTTKDRSPYWHC
jgi:hypothetical protein